VPPPNIYIDYVMFAVDVCVAVYYCTVLCTYLYMSLKLASSYTSTDGMGERVMNKTVTSYVHQ
jgi:hypothetical protein